MRGRKERKKILFLHIFVEKRRRCRRAKKHTHFSSMIFFVFSSRLLSFSFSLSLLSKKGRIKNKSHFFKEEVDDALSKIKSSSAHRSRHHLCRRILLLGLFFIQTEPRGRKVCDVFCRVPCPFQFSLFKKKLVFFLSCAEIFVFGFLLLPLLLLSSLPLSKRPERKKNIARRSPRVSIARSGVLAPPRAAKSACFAANSPRIRRECSSFCYRLRACTRRYMREREREREKRVETRRSRARKISSKNLLFSLSKAPKSPPPKEKGRKREEIQNKFSFKERKKERYDGAVLTINQRQSEDIVSRYRFFFI